MIIGVLLFTVDGLGQNVKMITVDRLGHKVKMRTFGGSGDDWGWSITTTSDGGYIMSGYTSSNDGDFNGMRKGNGDIFVMRLNNNCDIVWKKTFGGSDLEIGTSITTTSDGGYVLTGFTSSNDGDFSGMNKGSYDIFVLKLNLNGDIVWKKTFGGSIDDRGMSITTTSDGGYVLTGEISSNDGDFSGMNKGSYDIFVLKLNLSGDIVWNKTFGGSIDDRGRSITTTTDGGYVMSGLTNSNDGNFSGVSRGDDDNYDIFVIKLNQNGDTVWKNTIRGSYLESRNPINTTPEGGYLIIGETYTDVGDFSDMNEEELEYSVININSIGDIVSKETTNHPVKAIINSEILSSNGSIMTGYIEKDSDLGQKKINGGGDDIFVIIIHFK